MSEARYDVVIVERHTGRVDGIAGINLPLRAAGGRDDAEQAISMTKRFLARGMTTVTVPTGTAPKGSVIRLEGITTPYGGKAEATHRERRENCQCIDCGSPNIATRERCEPCAHAHNERGGANRRSGLL